MRLHILVLLAAVGGAAPAAAHTPYLLPNAFDAERPRVTLQGALTEDDYFNPDVALNTSALVETLPSGEIAALKPSAALKDVTLIEAALDQPGTYRFSTGPYAVRRSTYANVGGRWLMVRAARGGEGERSGEAGHPAGAAPQGPPGSIAAADVPAGAETRTAEQVMLVETYVSRGAPTEAALKTTGQGFELKPITHPNAIYVDQGFAFQLLVDGRPVPNAAISVYRSGNVYDERRIAVQLKTDAEGKGQVGFSLPGVYLLTTQYPAVRPAPGEPPAARSYTYSLTFEVTR
ncbi:DUF4198 domain-containing protein [Caulobacter sp. KR2-114]|uniref:DUF4198 domain-containing protein n=1 Tax=Caulobacter sp. KR2-114 TaxID=3400912 RepID=UPI003BFBF10E